MKRLLLPIAALLLSDAFLLVGHGIQITLLPIRAELVGFSSTQIAFTGSAYFAGFILGCLLAPSIIRRVGHIRSFAGLASAFSVAVLVFQWTANFDAWLLLRFCIGACISSLYMIIESWLNDRTDKQSRGSVLSIYNIINLSMIVAGQQLLNLTEPSAASILGLASIMLSLAIIPVSLTLSLAPAPLPKVKLDFKRVWEISHVALLGATASGLVTGAFWALGPVFAKGINMSTAQITTFMSATVLGGALFQFPLGKLSDKLDRRIVLLGAAILGIVTSMTMLLLIKNVQLVQLTALIWGGSVMTLYSICLAHGADNAEPHEFVMLGSCILLTFGISSALGAPFASIFIELIGPSGLFVYAITCLTALTVAIAIRRKQHIIPIIDETEPFRPVGDTSPAAFAMDPRTDELDAEEQDADQVQPDEEMKEKR